MSFTLSLVRVISSVAAPSGDLKNGALSNVKEWFDIVGYEGKRNIKDPTLIYVVHFLLLNVSTTFPEKFQVIF